MNAMTKANPIPSQAKQAIPSPQRQCYELCLCVFVVVHVVVFAMRRYRARGGV